MKQSFLSKLSYFVALTLIVSLLLNGFLIYKEYDHKTKQNQEAIDTVTKLIENYRQTELHLNALTNLNPYSDLTKSEYHFHINQALSFLNANENIIWVKMRIIPEYIKSFNNREVADLYSIEKSINFNHPDVKVKLNKYKKVLKNINELCNSKNIIQTQEPYKVLENMNKLLAKNKEQWK